MSRSQVLDHVFMKAEEPNRNVFKMFVRRHTMDESSGSVSKGVSDESV